MKIHGLILAAGKGTRMHTDLPKCAYPILRKPMIEYIVENMENSTIDDVVVVVGHKKEDIKDILKDRVKYAVQEEQLGTGHAVISASDLLKEQEGYTFIIPGDVPLISQPVIDKILRAHREMGNDLTVVSMIVNNPKGYGRILRDEYGTIVSIIEENDANEVQKTIREVNTGIYVVDNKIMFKILSSIKLNEKKKEYYLTDMVELMSTDYKVNSFIVRNPEITMGVNDLYGISVAEKYLREDINRELMLTGVSIVNPETVTIGHSVKIERGAVIMPNTTITGDTVIHANAVIGPNTELHNAVINKNTSIKHSYVYDSVIGSNTTIGPFAHIRQNSVIGDNNRIGNFVEIKHSTIGNKTNAAHLSYIGDSEVGSHVNFGCGSVTVNYDGKLKHKTTIGNDVFIGCNVNLIAPINIGDNVFLAAGSTVTQDVPSGSLAIARGRQINKEDYTKHLIQPKSQTEKE